MIDFQMMIHTYGKSPKETIRDYINIRYERWLDYSRYKCSKSGIEGEESDVLDVVLLDVLQKDEQLLMKLFQAKKVLKGKEYTELDFFILKALDLNITSGTSPYRYKNKCIPRANVELSQLKIVDDEYHEIDEPAKILKQMRLVRWVFNGLDLNELDRRVFEHVFFMENKFVEWNGPEKVSTIYNRYHFVEAVIHNVLYHLELTNLKPTGLNKKLENNQKQIDLVFELVEKFIRTRKIHRTRQSKQLVNA